MFWSRRLADQQTADLVTVSLAVLAVGVSVESCMGLEAR